MVSGLRRKLQRVLRLALVSLTLQAVVVTSSAAQSVAVLPMTSTARSLEIYETATATALAKRLGETIAAPVRAVASASSVAKDVRAVVDGRIVLTSAGKVKLEASVRRSATGKLVATVATEAQAVTDMDALVAALALTLSPVLVRALEPRAVIVLPTAVVHGTRAQPSVSPATATTPQVLVLTPRGTIAKGVISVVEPALAGAIEMLTRMNLASVRSQQAGSTDVLAIVAELEATGASYALLIDVRDVRFAYSSVLSARGTVRVAMIGRDGLPVFDKTMRTDTVVGGRGDRHPAIVFRVVDQAFDMLLPQLRKLPEIEARS